MLSMNMIILCHLYAPAACAKPDLYEAMTARNILKADHKPTWLAAARLAGKEAMVKQLGAMLKQFAPATCAPLASNDG